MANIRDLDAKGKNVLIRVDFNVPLDDEGNILDDTRMVKALPTIRYMLDQGATVVIMSHLGRPLKKLLPDGSIDIEKFTLKHLVVHLMELLEVHVEFLPNSHSKETLDACKIARKGEVILLENTRFYPGETKGEEEIASQFAQLADIYINDAFGAAHRAHASTSTVAKYFAPENKAFGFLMEEEIKNGSLLLNNPTRPVTAIVGGAKVSDKIQLIEKLMEFADNILIGGGMSYTFLKSQGYEIGNSLCEDDYLELASKLLEKAESTGTKIYLPQDSIVADKFAADAETKIVSNEKIEKAWMGLDIGPQAKETYRSVLLASKSILWNGPVGVFEMEAFAKGTLFLAEAIAETTDNGAYSLIGGGDSVSAVNQAGVSDRVSFISTGGGAMLEFLEGKTLPGIAAINE